MKGLVSGGEKQGDQRASVEADDGAVSQLPSADPPSSSPAFTGPAQIHMQVTLLLAFISVYWHVKDCNNIGQHRDL